jgi:putative mRNA 3-end processing factor
MTPFVTGQPAAGWHFASRGEGGYRQRLRTQRPLRLSGIIRSIKATGAEKIICTHGYSDIFSRYLREIGYDARTEQTNTRAMKVIQSKENPRKFQNPPHEKLRQSYQNPRQF